MQEECKYSCEIGELRADCKHLKDSIKDVESWMRKIDADLNNGMKKEIATISEHCKGHEQVHKNLAWNVGFKTFLMLGGAALIVYAFKEILS